MRANNGFTLLELAIATSILVLAVSLAMVGYVHLLGESNKSFIQSKLDIDAQVATEKIKRNMRLSALERMYYFSSTGTLVYSAVSMPLAQDDNGDGVVDCDTNNKIIWDKTLIYHRWAGSPSQLRLTTISPRDNNLTAAQFQSQCTSVATNGNASATFGSTNARTEVVFQNLFNWTVQALSSTYDGYASTTQRDVAVSLGSIALSNGVHTFKFTVLGKHPNSSGYNIGIDSLSVSPCGIEREGEAQFPASAVTGGVPTNRYVPNGSWSGNYGLYFPATATGHTFTVSMRSDRWEETNFRATGENHDNTTVLFDTSLSPSNFIVCLEGNLTNWQAATQSGDTNISSTVVNSLTGCAVRVVLRGNEMEKGNFITANGGRCRVNFASGASALRIENAFIMQSLGTDASTAMDAATNTITRLVFNGSNMVSLVANTNAWSHLANFSIDKSKSYLVSYLVNATNNGTARQWAETLDTAAIGCYVLPAATAPTALITSNAVWSTRAGLQSNAFTYGVQYLFATYATNGIYTSRIVDTACAAPIYSNLTWSSVMPTNTTLAIKVRTAASNDMSDASSWTNVTALTAPASIITPGAKRYLQYQAQLRPESASLTTPKLLDTAIAWQADTKVVDIGGTFTKGPDYGIFQMLVDGQPLKKGVEVDLEIYQYTRLHGTSNRITSAAHGGSDPKEYRKIVVAIAVLLAT